MYTIEITNKYISNTGNTEYWLCDETGELAHSVNLYTLIKETENIHNGEFTFWWQLYESNEAHDNGEELLNLYTSCTQSKKASKWDRMRIYGIEKYFLYEDIE